MHLDYKIKAIGHLSIMESLTTMGLVHFCHHEDDIELIVHLNAKKITGRMFSRLNESDFPENIRIHSRLLRRAIEETVNKSNQRGVLSNVTNLNMNTTQNNSQIMYTSLEPVLFTQNTTDCLSVQSSSFLNTPKSSNDISSGQEQHCDLSKTFVNAIREIDPNYRADEQNQTQSEVNNRISETQTPIAIEKKKMKKIRVNNERWPTNNFKFPYDKLDEKLIKRLNKPNKNINDSVLQKIIIKALYDKIYLDLKV